MTGWIIFRLFMLFAAVCSIGLMCRQDYGSSAWGRLYQAVLATVFLAAGVLWPL